MGFQTFLKVGNFCVFFQIDTKMGFQTFLKVGNFCVFFQINTKIAHQMTVLAFLKVGNFCVFFQINTKIAHLLATAEFKLLPPGGQFLCVLSDHTLQITITQPIVSLYAVQDFPCTAIDMQYKLKPILMKHFIKSSSQCVYQVARYHWGNLEVVKPHFHLLVSKWQQKPHQ